MHCRPTGLAVLYSSFQLLAANLQIKLLSCLIVSLCKRISLTSRDARKRSLMSVCSANERQSGGCGRDATSCWGYTSALKRQRCRRRCVYGRQMMSTLYHSHLPASGVTNEGRGRAEAVVRPTSRR